MKPIQMDSPHGAGGTPADFCPSRHCHIRHSKEPSNAGGVILSMLNNLNPTVVSTSIPVDNRLFKRALIHVGPRNACLIICSYHRESLSGEMHSVVQVAPTDTHELPLGEPHTSCHNRLGGGGGGGGGGGSKRGRYDG
ncbi:hypothetical protein P152DRAFT_40177 [Eremomyces bilateralis CBS 781.70]|uniref:Uncharacterized protein n=1 Tax=Eremomyces bilateralis CBS 781.70 TaxID=1392243 RepID=A0A6G1G1J1_9PEZI|nr:uncharacterized protein P152DRAFT_40177 [Eremomyces bilateralis CBS 781.70]KAF1811977.1 hypothetical protein P152DRAFT_40177 [Eremomyces bilateralis CBS 781.70]